MIKRSIGILFLLLAVTLGTQAQSAKSLRINEVLTNNASNYTDAFGNRGAWIEIYNSSAGTVQLAGCYLTNDKNNPKKYMISKGDVKTKIAPRQRVLIWADAQPHHGTFHANFALAPNATNYIALYDASGSALIDEVTVPLLAVDQSYGAEIDGDETRKVLAHPTPDAANYVDNSNPKVEKFKEKDKYGVGMAITAMSVVFSALLILFLVFKTIGKIAIRLTAVRAVKAGEATDLKSAAGGIPGEVLAAITMALYEHQEATHDYEETVLTMKRVTRHYSPWSSKIYGLRENPFRK